VKQTPGII